MNTTIDAPVQKTGSLAVSSQTATLLMCPPTLYEVSYVINPWMQGNLGNASIARANQQWAALHRVLSERANVLLVEPEPGSPDMVFTANAGLARGREVVLSSFQHAERQAEEDHFREWFEGASYDVITLGRETPFEGEGDALFTHDGSRLWVGHGPRTSIESHVALERVWGVEVVGLRLTDPRFYHLDTCFAPLSDGSLLYYPAAFDAASRGRIEKWYEPEKRIAVSDEDALAFSCNAINLGRTIICNLISADLECRLLERGFDVIQTPLDEFLKAGGAAKCLVMKLSSEFHGDEHVRNESEVCLV